MLLSRSDEDAEAQLAMSELCRQYWFPLYAYARRRGNRPPDAEDLTQEFFARLLSRRYLDAARKEKGRLRSFLLTLFKRFLVNERERAQAWKRGGGVAHVPIDAEWAEEQYGREPADVDSPELVYQRRWARVLLGVVVRRLRTEYAERGLEREFELLKEAITGSAEHVRYAVLGDRLDMKEGAVKTAVHRLRKRYRAILLEEIERTVASPGEVEDELRFLRVASRRP